MTAHDHTEIVTGCFRCEISADELNPAFDWPRRTTSKLDAIAARLEAARVRSEETLRDLPEYRLLSRAEADRQRLVRDGDALLAVVREVEGLAESLENPTAPVNRADRLVFNIVARKIRRILASLTTDPRGDHRWTLTRSPQSSLRRQTLPSQGPASRSR